MQAHRRGHLAAVFRTGIALAAALMAASAVAAVYAAEPARADTRTVEQRLEDTEAQVRVLARKLEIADENAAAAAKATPVVRATTGGFTIQSADGANVLRVRANLAVDGRYFLDSNTPTSADTFLLRRARPYIEGTLARFIDFRLMPDFGGGKSVVQDAWVTARFHPWFALQAGKFKGPVGLERLQPDQYNRFLELGLPSNLVPNRDLGVQASGGTASGSFTYALGLFDGVADGSSSDSNTTVDVATVGKRDAEGRVFVLPFVQSDNFALRGLGLGLGASYENATGTATSSATAVATNSLLPGYRSPGQQALFSYRGDTASTATINESTVAGGVRRRLAPQAYWYVGPLGLIGEYTTVTQAVRRQVDATTLRQANLSHHAWQLSASYFLTGEEAAYAAFTPGTTWQPGRPGKGAWELVARVQELALDPATFTGAAASFADPTRSVQSAHSAGVGVNWYLNGSFKLQLDYEQTRYHGGAAAGADRPSERALLSRFSLVF